MMTNFNSIRNILGNVIRDTVLNKTLSVLYNNFYKAKPEEGSVEMSRNM